MAGKFTQAIEIAHERFFAENPGLLGHSPLELDRIPRSTALFFEMLWADWRLRVERRLPPKHSRPRSELQRRETGW